MGRLTFMNMNRLLTTNPWPSPDPIPMPNPTPNTNPTNLKRGVPNVCRHDARQYEI